MLVTSSLKRNLPSSSKTLPKQSQVSSIKQYNIRGAVNKFPD